MKQSFKLGEACSAHELRNELPKVASKRKNVPPYRRSLISNERYVYVFADGTYITVIYHGEGCKMPILAVVGIAETGERDVLAFSVGDRENEQARTRPARRSQSTRRQSD